VKTFLIAAAMVLGFSVAAHAQTTTTSGAAAGAASVLNQYNIIPGGNTGNGSGTQTLNTNTTGTVWQLGGTPSMMTTQYDACTKYISASAILAGLSVPLEIEQCWSMRMADSIAKYPPGSVQYNLLCNDSNVLRNDWETNTMKCTKNIARLPKDDVRRVGYTGIPVVAVNQGPTAAVPAQVVGPQGLPLQATNAPVNAVPAATPLPRCSATIRDRCISG
jgi:hypothetical protein